MSTVPEELRRRVVARAGGCCEYGQLPVQGQVATFPVGHVLPRILGGATDLANQELSCPHCNAHKWAHVQGTNPETGNPEALYTPRTQRWAEHYQWSAHNPVALEGKTPTGRATIARLQMDHPNLLLVRQLLAQLGSRLGPNA